MSDTASVQKRLGSAAAVLMLLGLLTGGFAAAAMTGQIVADAHAALAAHLNAVMGCFWIAAVAFTLPMTRYGQKGQRALGWLTIAPNYSNWLITILKAKWKVAGVGLTGDSHNDIVFVLLNVFVVVPSLAAAGMWAYGFLGEKKN